MLSRRGDKTLGIRVRPRVMCIAVLKGLRRPGPSTRKTLSRNLPQMLPLEHLLDREHQRGGRTPHNSHQRLLPHGGISIYFFCSNHFDVTLSVSLDRNEWRRYSGATIGGPRSGFDGGGYDHDKNQDNRDHCHRVQRQSIHVSGAGDLIVHATDSDEIGQFIDARLWDLRML